MGGIWKFLLLFLVLLFAAPACGSTRKTKKAKKKVIMIDTPRYGKNKLYFSSQYQRQLKQRAKKNARKNRR